MRRGSGAAVEAPPSDPRPLSPPPAEAGGRLLLREPSAPPQQPVERIPQELGSLLPGPRERGAPAPAAAPASPGFLDIYVEPWANVTLDGRQLEKPTPITKLAVRPGGHHLVLQNPILGKVKVVDVTVSEGQTHKVEVYWVEK